MSMEMKLIEDEVKVLVYVKMLHETDLPDCPNYTVGQKLDVYGCEPIEMDAFEFDDILEKFCTLGIMEYDDLNDMYELTELGNRKLEKINLRFTDNTIKNIWNFKEWGEEFIKERGMDIVSFVSGIVFR